MLMNDKIMFDRYYCINSANHCEKEETIGALYFITSLHFPTRVRQTCDTTRQIVKLPIFRPLSRRHDIEAKNPTRKNPNVFFS